MLGMKEEKQAKQREMWKMEMLALKTINAQKKVYKSCQKWKRASSSSTLLCTSYAHTCFKTWAALREGSVFCFFLFFPLFFFFFFLLGHSKIQYHPQQNQPAKLTPQKNRKKKDPKIMEIKKHRFLLLGMHAAEGGRFYFFCSFVYSYF